MTDRRQNAAPSRKESRVRYDKEANVIRISCRELVATARRKISTSHPCDEDEPEIKGTSRRILSAVIGETNPYSAEYAFCIDGRSFVLTVIADKADGCKLLFASETEPSPARQKKEHAAQMRGEGYVTAYTYAMTNKLTRVELSFIYIDSKTRESSVISESADIKKLERFFKKCISSAAAYAIPEIERVTTRLPSMQTLKFPYKNVREGQSEFVRRTYKTIARGGVLYATAPTGTGKTVSALYPAIKAMGDGKRDKTFYLTPKETTAKAAIDCLELMAAEGAIIRAVKLTAKEKLCKRGVICRDNRERCENSDCNSLSEATLALYELKKTVVTDADIIGIAKDFTVCPYELALTYSELCDVIICDFNYLFDPAVYIRRFFIEGGNFTFLIDEAHNLPDRAREMYSAEISDTALRALADSDVMGEFSEAARTAASISRELRDILYPYLADDIHRDENGNEMGATHVSEPPYRLYELFDTLAETVEAEILLNLRAKDGEKELRLRELRDYLYKINRFRSALQSFDSSYEVFIFLSQGTLTVKLFCIDTGRNIAKRLETGAAAVFFSATLTPLYYYKSLLGGYSSSETLELESPFDTSQLSVSIMDRISTRTSEREDTLNAVCRAIAATVSAKRGNYMIFSPSFAYSEALSKAFSAMYPKIKVLTQTRNMSRREKDEFLAEFSKDDKSYLIGFCVMGGIYAEGIDLAGESLIGAVVVGIGMPALSYEREAICAYYEERYEEGKQFAYIYPGMNRVLQAAGRVIRREDDRGVIVLIDDRFDDPIYKKIIPKLWRGMRFISDAKQLRANLDEFWQRDNDNL